MKKKERVFLVGLIIALLIAPVVAYQQGQNSLLPKLRETRERIQELEQGFQQILEENQILEQNLTAAQEQIQTLEQKLNTAKQESAKEQEKIKELEKDLKQLKDIKRVAIIVEESIGQQIQTNLNRYATEIESLYYNVRITQYMGDWKTYAELRSFIQNLYYNGSGVSGVILVGILPYALWEYSPAGTPDIGPLPFYYEDMDGTFEDKDSDGIFDHYVWGENEGPEIWVSWMRPDSDNVTRSLNDYLEKLHNYYSGNISYQNKALVVVTEDWGGWISELSLSLEKIYPEVTSIGGSLIKVTAEQYLNEYHNWYELTNVWSHGDSNDQEFDQGTNLFGEEVKSLSGGSKLTLIWACHVADFHKTPINNLAASYVFDNNFGLAAIAATRSIGIEKHEIVFQSLNEGDILGKAFFDWINLVYDKSFIQDRFQQEILIDRFMWGFILIGDPFIQLDKYQNFLSN